MLEVTGIDHAHDVLAEPPLVQLDLTAFECLAVGAFTGFDALLEGVLDQ